MTAAWMLEETTFAYGGKAAIAGISAEIAAGCFYGVVGPNGSGKTTLLDLLAGVLEPAEGAVFFNGRSLSEYRRRELARGLALVPQEFRIGFGFSVFDCVMMGRHPHIGRFGRPGPEDFRLVDAALTALDLTELADRPVTALSGGEKQRVMVARALAQDAPALLLDEATSNLDVRHSIDILRRCRRLVEQEGRTVVAVLHDLNLAAAFCDRLLVLDRGRIAAGGPTAEVLTPELVRLIFGVEARVENGDGHPRIILQYREVSDV